MAWKKKKLTSELNIKYFAWEEEKPDKKYLYLLINPKKERIDWFPYPRYQFILKHVVFDGFDRLPKGVITELGRIPSVQGYLQELVKKLKAKHLWISAYQKTKTDKYYNSVRIILNFEELKTFKNTINSIIQASQKEKTKEKLSFFHSQFPRNFPEKATDQSKVRARLFETIIDKNVIKHLSPEGQTKLVDFFEEFLKGRYSASKFRRKFFTQTKIKVDSVTLDELISTFEKKILDNPQEKDWGEFLKKNLFLIDSKYVNVIPEACVSLVKIRKVDFAMVDYLNYMDLFEIKRPSTQLFSKEKDRHNNYNWHKETAEAITQAEKYLHLAESNSGPLEKQFKDELDENIRVTKPQVFLIVGNYKKEISGNKPKENDFRILRNSLKNIQIITYDELLAGLKIQKESLTKKR